jgi:TetR/AcrR family transcriptional regulator
MHDNYDELTIEKKKLIIDASIDEISKSGYDNASTNIIAKAADISEEILFNYFGSKRKLYLYVVDYCTQYYIGYLKENINESSTDFFERILHLTELRLDLSVMNPKIYHFFTNAYLDIPNDLKDEIEAKYRRLLEVNNNFILRNVDRTKFKDEIDTDKAIELIYMTFNGLVDKYVQIYKSYENTDKGVRDETIEELKQYVVIMKLAFYK